ncbi:MAG TPA: tRNA (adenosine(37)-N6)-threonylcarbamoyltransferase complex transferase subunit TsaD [Herpetosiphonaceae bacterium]
MTEQPGQQLPAGFTILAVETSCDETAAAVIRDGREILANTVASQIALHERYGGVVPEVASRQHILTIAPVVEQTLAKLPGGWADVHAVAATYGPGLSGALLTGINTAKALAWGRGLPFVGVNHLEGHIYASWLRAGTPGQPDEPPQFPLVALIVSGGHTALVLLRGHGDYRLLGQTRDDAVGEAFDKVARIMGLGYPGGPLMERIARDARPSSLRLPRAWLRDSYDMSFSGLKTAVLNLVQERMERREGAEKLAAIEPQYAAQLAAAFQDSVVDVLVKKTIAAAREHKAREIILAGGVAANTALREALTAAAAPAPVRYPPIWLCTDNAAMIGAAAYFRYQAGLQRGWALDAVPSLRLAPAPA